MGMVDKIVNNVDVEKMEFKNRCKGNERVFGGRREVTIDREEWVRLKKKGNGSFINK